MKGLNQFKVENVILKEGKEEVVINKNFMDCIKSFDKDF